MEKEKTEKEKMMNGEYYDSNEIQLLTDRRNCKKILYKLNHHEDIDDYNPQLERLDKLLGSHGKSTYIEPPFYCDYGYNIHVGDNFYCNFNCCFLDGAKIEFGDNCFLGPNVQIYTPNHPIDYEERATSLEYCLKIKIGNDVWIGGNTTIVPGITIGDNVVIGAGSVVCKSIPSDSLAVGNPCKVIKQTEKKHTKNN